MKKYILCLAALFALLLTACTEDTPSAGGGLSGHGDIIVKAQKIDITSSLLDMSGNELSWFGIYTTPDSFLIGECDNRFGTLHADMLTQLVCPEGFQYPEGAVLDSVCLFVYYSSFFGDGQSPLMLNVYEMDGEVMRFNNAYSSFAPLSRFVSDASLNKSIVTRPRTILAANPTDSVYSGGSYVPFIRFRMTDEWAEKLFSIRDFSSQEQFNALLKGVYITSEFGGSTILHVSDVAVTLHYHFPYTYIGQNDTIWETDIKGFYANTEVRQINRYEYINSQVSQLSNKDVNYVVSPGNVFTSISLPIRQLCLDVQDSIGDKRAYINRAQIIAEVLNYSTKKTGLKPDEWAQPSQYMMLIERDEMEHFFRDQRLPNDSTALLGSITSSTDSLSNKTYYYSYDLSNVLTRYIRRMERAAAQSAQSAARSTLGTSAVPDYAEVVPETLEMVLVPVDVTSSNGMSGESSITRVAHKQTVSCTAIRSAQSDTKDYTQWEIVYSGF